MITKKYYKLIRVSHADSEYFRITNISNEIGEFSISKYSSGTMEYSLDGVNWTSYDLSTKPSVSVNPNSNIYLRGTNFKNTNTNGSVIKFTQDYTVGGNFMSLSNYSTMSSVTTIDNSNIIQCAFNGQTHLLSASDLNFGNVTSVGDYGLRNVFNSTSLTAGPDFSGFTSIGNYALFNTFGYCTSLITPPDLSNVTSIVADGLNQAFTGCTSLVAAPDLSSVTSIGNNGLNQAFKGCTSLITGPDFSNVTSTGNWCFNLAFYNCSKLSNVTAPNVSDLTQNGVLSEWLSGAGSQATGTKIVNVPTGATIATNSVSGIPTGWTRVDY